jgi:hypothetical protein
VRATFALIRFELERQGLVPAVALAIGIAVLALPYLPGGPSRLPPEELRTVAAGISVVAYVVFVALALGASLLARDLAERRASFLFARPLAAGAIALGRLAAALLLLLLSALLVVAPALLAGAAIELPAPGSEIAEGPGVLLAFLGLATVSLLLISAVVLAARARTGWIVLELAGAAACGLAVWRAFGLLRLYDLEAAPRQLGLGLAAAAPIALAAIYLAPFLAGRADLARAHRAQALAAGLLLPAIGAGALAWARDYLNPSVAEIVAGALLAQPLGEGRFAIVGSEPGREQLLATALVDGEGGLSRLTRRLSGESPVGASFVARAGDTFYWPEHDGGEFRLVRAAFDGGVLRVEPTGVAFDRFPSRWAVSADTRRFAGVRPTGARSGVQLAVSEVATGRLLASRTLPVSAWWDCRIEAEGDGFRLLGWVSGVALQSWSIAADGSATSTGSAALPEGGQLWHFDPERARVFVREAQPQAWVVLDARTLAPIFRARPALLDAPGTALSGYLHGFADGAVAVSVRQGERRELSLYSPAGEPLGATSWTGPATARVVGLGDRAVLVAVPSGTASDERALEERAAGWTVLRIDLAGGSARVVARDLLPLRSHFLVRPGPALLRDDALRLFALDAESGELGELNRSW